MNFINNDAKLRSFIPNVFSSVEGEVSLFDKMKTHLQFAESWLDIKKGGLSSRICHQKLIETLKLLFFPLKGGDLAAKVIIIF